jgi:hypothetical protein
MGVLPVLSHAVSAPQGGISEFWSGGNPYPSTNWDNDRPDWVNSPKVEANKDSVSIHHTRFCETYSPDQCLPCNWRDL